MKLTPDQLAEGRRLLEEFQQYPDEVTEYVQCDAELSIWLSTHAEALIAAADHVPDVGKMVAWLESQRLLAVANQDYDAAILYRGAEDALRALPKEQP